MCMYFNQQGVFSGDVVTFNNLRYLTDLLEYIIMGALFGKVYLDANKSAGLITHIPDIQVEL